jgi:hypothetical protein
MTGARIGTWVLGREIGRGPVGVVYRAAAADGRPAAVKLLTHPAARGPVFLARFPAEMLALQRLNHPNVVRFYDSGVAGGTAFYASELVEGTDLGSLLKSRPKSPTQPGLGWRDDLVRIAVQAARGLKHGHHRSVLHRDLKPSNVLVAADGTVKLSDFGVAKVVNLPPLALDPDPWGTAGFLAPEHFTGKPLTRRSDLYALGGVLWTVLGGRPPFTAGSAAEYLHKHCYTLPDRPANLAPKLPAELDELICGLLSKDPARRPQSAAAVLDQLSQLRGKWERKGIVVAWPSDPGDGTGLEAALAEGGGPTASSEDRGRPLMSRPLVVGGLLVGVLMALGYGVFRPRPTADELYEAARPLLASDDPADWDRAVDEYLDPLSRRFPDWHADEVQRAVGRVTARRELRRLVGQGAKAKYGSEAERWYQVGLRQAQAGDPAGAKRTWEGVTRGFTDAPWVDLATAGLAELARTPQATPPRAGLAAALDRAKGLPEPDRARALEALAGLYRDVPAAVEAIRAGRLTD